MEHAISVKIVGNEFLVFQVFLFNCSKQKVNIF